MRIPKSPSPRPRKPFTISKLLRCIQQTSRRGGILIFFALLIPVILAFVMLTVDIGLITVDRTQLQRTADAIALAAVQELGDSDTETAIANAKAIAVEYAQENSVLNGLAVEFDPDNDLVFGQTRVNSDTGQTEFFPNEMPPNALVVTAHHNLQHTAFARIWGKESTWITTTASASKKERDYMIVLDVSCPTTYESYEADVCRDLDDLGIRECSIDSADKDEDDKDDKDKDEDKDNGNNGVGNGEDSQPPGDPPVNDGPGTSPGDPGNQGGADKDEDKDMDEDKDVDEDKDMDEDKDKDEDKDMDEDKDKDEDKDMDEDKDVDEDKDMDEDKDKDEDKDMDEDKDKDKDSSCCTCTFDGKDADLYGAKDEDKDEDDKDEDKDSDDEPSAMETALSLTYEGNESEFSGIYEVGDRYLPPSVRIQPLKAIKDAAANAVDILEQSGYDDLLGAVAYSDQVNWSEPLTTDYSKVRARFRGAAPFEGARLDLGIQAARQELSSERARGGSHKTIVIVSTGNSDSGQALAEAQSAADAGMTIHCIGVGSDVDKDLLDTIAAMTGGKAVYVELSDDSSVYEEALKTIFNQVSLDRVHNRLMQNP